MYKKLFISIILLLSILFSFNACFANNGLQDAANGVRNAVGNAENAVEGAARGVSDASKNATGNMENKANELGNDAMNTAKNANNTMTNIVGGTDGNYIATRTATTGTTFMGMNATAWTWLILGIAAVAIIALVWYYATQFNSTNYNDKD